ncbi:MAG: VOC family protein [Actinomycetota bacterium]
MSERNSYSPGEFCWVDLAAPDVDSAVAFYGDLMGWQARSAGPMEETGGYGFFEVSGKMVAGYGPTQNEFQPPAWAGYVAVEDADVTAAKVADAGGTVVVPPMDLPQDSGRMLVFQDPEGAFISALKLNTLTGAGLVNEVGTWTWNQLGTRDTEGAKAFYGSVFGWTAALDTQSNPEDPPYLMWHVDGQRWEEGLAGMMEMDANLPSEIPAHWLVYFAVPGAQEAVDKTVAAGGQVTLPPTKISVGTIAVLTDPQGAAFAVLEPDFPESR